jgi:phosphatidate cytidylyltransferase
VNDKNRNLVVRVVSAVLLLPAVLALLITGGWPAAVLFAVAAAGCTFEYQRITSPTFGAVQAAAVAGAALMALAAHHHPAGFGSLAFAILALVFFIAWIAHLMFGPFAEAPVRSAHAVTGCLYGGLGLASLAALRENGAHGLQWVIAALVMTWANDTCAYFAGRLLGRHPLYPAVSPNKTWEGFFGGMAGSVAGMFIARWVAFPALTPQDCTVLGLVGGVLGPLGDLCESMLKRAYQVKDSGHLIPGHGGLLDRVDALLFNAPAVYLYVTLFHPLLHSRLPGEL